MKKGKLEGYMNISMWFEDGIYTWRHYKNARVMIYYSHFKGSYEFNIIHTLNRRIIKQKSGFKSLIKAKIASFRCFSEESKK